MIGSRDPFGRVLTALRRKLRSSAYVCGEPLTIVELARELGVSPTPVREALSRLAGEGLIVDRRGHGYFAWRADVSDLVDLYDLNLQHMTAALEAAPATRTPRERAGSSAQESLATSLGEQAGPHALAMFSESLFGRIVAQRGNRALIGLHAILGDRLAPAREIEPVLIEDMTRELGCLARLFDEQAGPELLDALRVFHERRRSIADLIVNTMRRDGLPQNIERI